MYIGKVTYGNNTWPITTTLFGTCETAADTSAKVVVMPDFDALIDGVTIRVLFKYKNNTNLTTLNVNNTGAFLINKQNHYLTKKGCSWNAGSVVTFTYHKDGSTDLWYIDDPGIDTYKLTVNGTTNGDNDIGTSLGILYAPTTVGTLGQYLKSSGDGAPVWADFPSSMPASDVYAWAKAATKPSYTLDEVSDGSTRKLSNYLPLSGGTLSGQLFMAAKLVMKGYDIEIRTSSSSSDDSGDIVFFYGNGSEKSRIWTDNTYTTGVGPYYRVYKSDGTSLYTGRLATVGELGSYLPLSGGTLTGNLTGTSVYADLEQARVIAINHHTDNFSASDVRGAITYGRELMPSQCVTPLNRGWGIYMSAYNVANYSKFVLSALDGIYLDNTTYVSGGGNTQMIFTGSGLYSTIRFTDSVGNWRIFGINADSDLFVTPKNNWNAEHTVWHSGNFNITTGSTNGTVSVRNTDVPVKGLSDFAYINNLEGVHNLAKGTDLRYKADGSDFGSNTRTSSVVITDDDGYKCVKITATSDSNVHYWNCTGARNLKSNTVYTWSYYIKSSVDINFGYTSVGHYQVYNDASTKPDKAHEDTRLYTYPSSIAANTWTRVWVRFRTNELSGSTFKFFCYNIPANSVFYIRNFKLEESPYPTGWCPNDEDYRISEDGVASAAKLVTARSIFGQSFDGSADIGGTCSNLHTLDFTGVPSNAGHGGIINFHYNGSSSVTSYIKETNGDRIDFHTSGGEGCGFVRIRNHATGARIQGVILNSGQEWVYNIARVTVAGNPYTNSTVVFGTDGTPCVIQSSDTYNKSAFWVENASYNNKLKLYAKQNYSCIDAIDSSNNPISIIRYGGEQEAYNNDLILGLYNRDVVIDNRNLRILCDEAEVMRVTKWGNCVGIGTTSPSYKLHVNGACAASSFPNTSDIRLKDVYSDWSPNIEDIAYAPSFLFKWKDGKDKNMHAGTSAQYWLSKAPELATEAKDDIGTLSIQYDVLGALSSITLAKEILELKKEIKRLQALIAEIKLLQK